MWWLLLALLPMAWAQEELDLSSVRNLEEKLPDYNHAGASGQNRLSNKQRPPYYITKLDKILASDTELGAISNTAIMVRIEDNKSFLIKKFMYVRYHQLEDEHQFKYLVNKDGSVTYKIPSDAITPIKQELAMYEPPLKYTPAPKNRVISEYDKKLDYDLQPNVLVGPAMGYYMQDLFNDADAKHGVTTQVGGSITADWKYPIKIGAVVNYEKTTYSLSTGDATYTGWSFGPLVRSKDFEIFSYVLRGQVQFRYGPSSKVIGDALFGPIEFQFRSTDVIGVLEHPIKNEYGELAVGVFYQSQWLNIKNQQEIVALRGSNRANVAFGLSLGQVF